MANLTIYSGSISARDVRFNDASVRAGLVLISIGDVLHALADPAACDAIRDAAVRAGATLRLAEVERREAEALADTSHEAKWGPA